MSLFEQLGYSRVSHFPGGLQEWEAAALRVQAGAPISTELLLKPQRPIRIRRDRWGAFVDLFERRTTADLVWIWMGTIAVWALLYWALTRAGIGGLREGDAMIGGGRSGFMTALYFSFGAATSIALGDVAPIGPLRVLAIGEAVVGLLVFGAMVSKLVSRRQEHVVSEIHRIAFEDRLGRVQTDLHLVLAEMQDIEQLCRAPGVPAAQVRARADSASGMCLAELRTIHALLYRPQELPEEVTLEGILASLASVLRELHAMVQCLDARSPYLTRNLNGLSRLAVEICADCVPRRYTQTMREWMDEIQSVARDLG